ncbi:MAG: hypothetical protein WC623_12980 [Pedobacter sp.]|uniref:hypothetical protein n=1 Tax=Pedobacter sp. TaxID=1411316 RepID=UPI0035632FF1
MDNQMIFVRIATTADFKYADEIVKETATSAISRGSGIAKRTVESLHHRMEEGKAVIAVTGAGDWVGFSYFEVWDHGTFVSNSGLIVAPQFRNAGVAKAIKERIFKMSRRMYPEAKIFSITSGSTIMKMNSRLGFDPVSFAEITQDECFWEGCKSCVNYNILESKRRCNCLCTAMLFDPQLKDIEMQTVKTEEEKQVMVLDCVAYPRASLVPFAEGTNAICAALMDIKWFTDFVFPIEGQLPNPVEMKVTGVNTNFQQLNSASQCNFTVEIVYDHNYTVKEILNVIKNHTWCKFKVRDEGFKFIVVDEVAYQRSVVSNNY